MVSFNVLNGTFVDDHDVVRFSVYSLRSPDMALSPDLSQDAESKKFEEEFEEYQKRLEQQKDDWAKQNPDKVFNSTKHQLTSYEKDMQHLLLIRLSRNLVRTTGTIGSLVKIKSFNRSFRVNL